MESSGSVTRADANELEAQFVCRLEIPHAVSNIDHRGKPIPAMLKCRPLQRCFHDLFAGQGFVRKSGMQALDLQPRLAEFEVGGHYATDSRQGDDVVGVIGQCSEKIARASDGTKKVR